MAAVGFDFEHGRLDVSLHPFCGGVPDDVRITTRYDEADFAKALMGVLHETGHALYERGLPAKPGACSRWVRRAAWRSTRASRCWSRCRPAVRPSSSTFVAPLVREALSTAKARPGRR